MIFKSKAFTKLTAGEIYEILRARAQVFIVELGMNCLDPDGDDYNALHMFLEDEGRVIAYLRALPDTENVDVVKIGRVLTVTHGVGNGRALMERAISEFKNKFGFNKITLHSQKTAVGFYKKLGFEICSNEFLEEGIVHISMEKKIQFKKELF